MSWVSIAQPTPGAYTTVNPMGLEQYDDADVLYDDPNTFYDGTDTTSWTSVSNPSIVAWTNVPNPS